MPDLLSPVESPVTGTSLVEVFYFMRLQQINSYKDTTEALNSLGHHRSKGSVDNGTEQPHRRADTWHTAGQRTGNTNSHRHAGGWRRTDGGS